MATLATSSSLFFSSASSDLLQPSLSPLPRLSLSSFSSSLSSSLSISHSVLTFPTISTTRRKSLSSFSIRASTAEKKKVLIVNTNSGGHAVIGFYFAKELLGSGHEVTIMTVGEENSDKMKKPPFTRFSVKLPFIICNYGFYFNFFNIYVNNCEILALIFGNLFWVFDKFSGNCECWWQDNLGRSSRCRERCGRSSI